MEWFVTPKIKKALRLGIVTGPFLFQHNFGSSFRNDASSEIVSLRFLFPAFLPYQFL
jgi:hypothetical protein